MESASPLRAVLTAPEAAKKYRLSRRYLVYLVSDGLVRGRKAGGTWLLDATSLKGYLAQPRRPGPKPRRQRSAEA
jgi:excisionase family DNA binding protein